MRHFQKAKSPLIPHHNSGFKEPCLTDVEAALILLQMHMDFFLVPPNHHPQQESRSQSQKPMYDNSDNNISGTATDMNNDKRDAKTSQPIGSDSNAAALDAPSNDMYSPLNKTSPATSSGHDWDRIIPDVVNYAAVEANSFKRADCDSNVTVSNPALKKKSRFARKRSFSTMINHDSDATISDTKLDRTVIERKCKHLQNKSGLRGIANHDSENPTSVFQSNVDDRPKPASAQLKSHGGKGIVNKISLKNLTPRHCTLCKQVGHNRAACPTIICTYKECNERGHVFTDCPERLSRKPLAPKRGHK